MLVGLASAMPADPSLFVAPQLRQRLAALYARDQPRSHVPGQQDRSRHERDQPRSSELTYYAQVELIVCKDPYSQTAEDGSAKEIKHASRDRQYLAGQLLIQIPQREGDHQDQRSHMEYDLRRRNGMIQIRKVEAVHLRHRR